jgi:hypothetical protein
MALLEYGPGMANFVISFSEVRNPLLMLNLPNLKSWQLI